MQRPKFSCILFQDQPKQQHLYVEAEVRLSYFYIEYGHYVTDNFRCNDIS